MHSFDPIIAEAYRRAALEGRDMYAFAGQMNRIKNAIADESGLYKQWEKLDDLIAETILAASDPNDFQLVRQVFIDQLGAYFSEQILQPKAKISEDWQRWKQAFSEASFHWQLQALQALCGTPRLQERFEKKLDPYRQFIKYFINRRWIETRPLFHDLATDKNLSEEQRGYHTYVCGQIDQYFHYDYDQAKKQFELAQKMLSGKPMAFHGLIEYYLKGAATEKNFDKALELVEEALKLDPNHVSSIIQKGDILTEMGRLAEAENYYRMACRLRPGYTQCYTRLIDLFGKAELFEKKEGELASLMEMDAQLDPQTSFLTRTDLGGIYQQQGEKFYEKAEEYHRAAMEEFPEGLVAPLNLGYFYLDYQKYTAKASELFETINKQAPDAWESHLAMARLHETQENWEAALVAYERVQDIIPSWERFMLTSAARCLLQLKRQEEAEKKLLQAWKLDAWDDSGALSEIYEIAQQYYKTSENPQIEKALRLLKNAAQVRNTPSATAAGIANRRGHVYFFVEQYDKALPFYQQAAELEPKEPVYYTNQFDCLENLYRKSPDETIYRLAVTALDRAAALAPKDSTIGKKRRQLALVRHNPDLAELPTLFQVHIEVGQPLLSQITLDFESLLPEMTTLTDALRTRVKERYAITLPGLQYRDISDGDGVYQFRLYDTPVWLNRLELVEGEAPTMAAVLDQFEQFITNYCLDLFVNYWDVDKEVPLLPNDELVHFTRVVMALLAEQIPIPALPELHQHYRRIDGPRRPVSTAVEQLRLWEKLRIKLPGAQDNFHYVGFEEQEEQRLESFLTGEGNARALALPMEYIRRFMGAIIRKTQELEGQHIAIVTTRESLRPYLRSVLVALPQVPVLKATELASGSDRRFLEALHIDIGDEAVFLQAFQDLQTRVSPQNDPLNSDK